MAESLLLLLIYIWVRRVLLRLVQCTSPFFRLLLSFLNANRASALGRAWRYMPDTLCALATQADETREWEG
jgi:hypothetical protein